MNRKKEYSLSILTGKTKRIKNISLINFHEYFSISSQFFTFSNMRKITNISCFSSINFSTNSSLISFPHSFQHSSYHEYSILESEEELILKEWIKKEGNHQPYRDGSFIESTCQYIEDVLRSSFPSYS